MSDYLRQQLKLDRMNIKIRKAELKDLDTLRLLEQGVIQYERPFAPTLKKDPIQYYNLENLIQREDAEVLVASIDGEIIGSGYALIKNSSPVKKPAQYVHLGFMYVSPTFRGKGINGKIMDQLTKWGKERNLTEFQLDVYAENESAIKAYAKKGFHPYLLKMRFNTGDDLI